MATEIRVPALGESVTEATVGRWFKKAGEPVNADEPIVELETDKVTLEVNAPASGVLAEIVAKDGETVSAGALLGQIGDTASAAPPKAEAKPVPPPAPPVSPAPAATPAPRFPRPRPPRPPRQKSPPIMASTRPSWRGPASAARSLRAMFSIMLQSPRPLPPLRRHRLRRPPRRRIARSACR